MATTTTATHNLSTEAGNNPAEGVLVKTPLILVGFIFANFLIPTFPEYTRGGLYFGTLVIVGVISLLVGIMAYYNRLSVRNEVFWGSFSFLCAFILLTMFSLFIDMERVVVSDFIEFFKPLFAFLLFIGFYASVKSVKAIKTIVAGYAILFTVVALIGIFEAHLGFHSLTHVLYVRPRTILMGKAVAPFGATYFYASFMLFAVIYYFSRFISASRISIAYLVLFLLSSFALLSSQSRTLFLSLIVMVAFFLTFYHAYDFPGGDRVLYFFTPLLLIIVFITFIYFDSLSIYFRYLYGGLVYTFQTGIDPSGAGSADVRVSQILWSYENNTMHGIIGSGIGKGYSPTLESFYALYVYRYGAVGILLYILIAAIFLAKSYEAARIAFKRGEQKLFAFFLALHVFIILLPLTSIASVITDQFVFLIMYYGNFGLTLRYIHLIESRHKPRSFKVLKSMDNLYQSKLS